MSYREPDFDLIVKVRNNHMVAWRERLNMTAGKAAEFCDVSYTQWLDLEYCRSKAFTPAGHLRVPARRISEAMDMLPEEIWPEVMRKMRRAMVRLQTSAPESLLQAGIVSLQLPSPEDVVIRENIRAVVRDVVEAIAPAKRSTAADNKERLKLRYGIGEQDEEMRTESAVGQMVGTTGNTINRSVREATYKVRSGLRSIGFTYDDVME